MFTYEARQTFHRFSSFTKAAFYLDTLVSVLADFEITTDYTEDQPICIKTNFFYPVKKES